MDSRRIIGIVVAVILLLGLLACCWSLVINYFYDQDPEVSRVRTTPAPPIEAPETASISLNTVEPREEDCATVYDFDLKSKSGTIYCLAVVYEEELYLLIDSPRAVSDVSWDEMPTTVIDSPPEELEMTIEGGHGIQSWHQVPSEAIDAGELVITLE